MTLTPEQIAKQGYNAALQRLYAHWSQHEATEGLARDILENTPSWDELPPGEQADLRAWARDYTEAVEALGYRVVRVREDGKNE